MKSSHKNLPGSLAELSVELTLEEFNEYWQPVFDQALAQVHLKGFRPGQAPREMAKNAVDQEKVFEKAAHEAIKFTLNKVAEDNDWTIIDKPQVTIDSHDKGFKYTAKLTLFPEIQLGNYKKIAEKWSQKFAEEKKDIAVTEKEVNDSVEWLRNSRGKLTEEEFIKSLGKDFGNLNDLKKSIKEGILIEKENKEKDKNRIKIIEEIVQESKIDIPQVMIDKVEKQFGKEEARKRTATQLVMYKIVQLENLTPTDEEIKNEMKSLPAGRHGVDNPQFYDYIYNVIQNRKVFDFLEGNKK